ncbi:two-component system capsular synthesis sensor histidine kinase RcsC [Pseudomonas frederiksbergensis]|uniref:ATP-binding protein n=1 Tax=Pseudomonas frederiksbergensis TaxID=104087 RepID=UPI003D1D0EFF
MKLKHFISPIDSSFSTPQAARKLLHLFATALILGVYMGAYSFLANRLSDEISLRRGYMNTAISDAQGFFMQRESLLKSLVLSTIRNPADKPSDAAEIPGEQVHVQLGSDTGRWSLWLTRRMLGYLQQNKVNLLYIAPGSPTQITRLFNASEHHEPVPSSVLNRLASLSDNDTAVQDDLWLTDQSLLDSPLYIFTRLDERVDTSGWLGFEVRGPDVLDALRDEQAGDFMLLDNQSQLIFASAAHPRLSLALQTMKHDQSFGFVGGNLLPEHLMIQKQLGDSDWRLVYSIDLRALLSVLAWPLFIALLACALLTWLMCRLVRRIDLRMIIPAAHRIEALVESEAFSRAVIQIAPIALCVLRRSDAEVVLENALSQQWLGDCVERQQLGSGWIRQTFEHCDGIGTDEFEIADGRHLFLSFAPTRYRREDVLICAFSDISARKQVELALQQARRSAEEANAAKTLFLATMSHEIRTPLYGVLGTLELLGRTELNGQQQNYLKAIEGSSANLLQLICDVLDVSKIEAGQLSLEQQSFSVLELVHEVIQGYAGAAQSKGLHLFAVLAPQLPECLIGDITRIRQILNNLLSNALKFTDSGHIILRARLDSRDNERAMLSFQVSDTGKGIAHEDQPFLFEPFYQADVGTNLMGGTGLGLSICKRLMHLMNGHIRLVSEPGLGSSFTLSMPLEQNGEPDPPSLMAPLQAELVYVVSPLRELTESFCGWLRRWGAQARVGLPTALESVCGAVLLELHPGVARQPLVHPWHGPRVICSGAETDAEQDQVNLSDLSAVCRAVARAQGQLETLANEHPSARPSFDLNLHVLVAEDNVINQLILKDQLEELGCRVKLTHDGAQALQAWQAGAYDIILTDINMPRMNGYELAGAVRQHDLRLPIIGATANAMSEEAERCLAAGMNECLVKPFALHTLFKCLRTYERRRNEDLSRIDR